MKPKKVSTIRANFIKFPPKEPAKVYTAGFNAISGQWVGWDVHGFGDGQFFICGLADCLADCFGDCFIFWDDVGMTFISVFTFPLFLKHVFLGLKLAFCFGV